MVALYFILLRPVVDVEEDAAAGRIERRWLYGLRQDLVTNIRQSRADRGEGRFAAGGGDFDQYCAEVSADSALFIGEIVIVVGEHVDARHGWASLLDLRHDVAGHRCVVEPVEIRSQVPVKLPPVAVM